MKPIWVLRPEGFLLKEGRPLLKCLVGCPPDQALFFTLTLAAIDCAERAFCAKLVVTACSTKLVPAIIADAETLRWCEIAVAETESYSVGSSEPY
jgi:hypothetical protein